MRKFFVLFLLLALIPSASALFDVGEINFFPVILNNTVDMYASSTIIHEGIPVNVTFTWLVNDTLTRTVVYTNVDNASTQVDLLASTTFGPADAIVLNVSAFNGTVLLTRTDTVKDCNDGIDNDGDGDIDYIAIDDTTDSDSSCVALYDDTEDIVEGLACTTTGGGSTPIYHQQVTPAGFTTFIGPEGDTFNRNDYLDAIQDITTDEIPCNNRDDNGNGLIDENCLENNITMTTQAGAKRFVLYVPPGTIREDRKVRITNLGRDLVPVTLHCTGQTACDYITFAQERINVRPSPDLFEEIGFTIDVPISAQRGEEYLLQFIATDEQSGQQTNVLLELHIDNRLAVLENLDDIFGKPLCRNALNGRIPICTNGYQLGIASALILALVFLISWGVIRWIRERFA